MMLPMRHQGYGIAARRASLHINTVNFDVRAGTVGDSQSCIPLVERVVAAEV